MLRHRGGGVAARIAHGDAEFGCGGHIDVVDAGGGGANQFEPFGFFQLRALQHNLVDHHHIGVSDGGVDLIGGGIVAPSPVGHRRLQATCVQIFRMHRSDIQKNSSLKPH